MAKKKKPNFLRQDWHKKIKLGSSVKKKRKWRAAKGRQSKIRMNMKGHITRPKIGFGARRTDEKILRIENLKQLENIGKVDGIIIARVGKKKKIEIEKKAQEMKLKILNKYKKTGEKK